MNGKRGLGKGLDALFEGIQGEALEKSSDFTVKEGIQALKVLDIDPNPLQPRKEFDNEKIQEMADSIRQHGVLQPIVVKPMGRRYVLVAGERRWRASKLAGIQTIPAVVMDMDDQKMMEIALIENLQREDLNPMEAARGMRMLMQEHRLTQEEIALRLGKSRPAVANSLRLLNLSEGIQDMISQGKLSPGHARTLLSLENSAQRENLAKIITDRGLNVRETEKLIKASQGRRIARSKADHPNKPPYLKDIEAALEEALGTRVEISPGHKKGTILIEYYSDEDLERILEQLRSIARA
jgi:ParB family chromosome partitioning protein